VNRPSQRASEVTRARQSAPDKPPGLPLVGSGPCAHEQRLDVHNEPRAQDGVNLGTAVRVTVEAFRTTASNLDTLPAEGSAEGAHAVEFSKTVAPLRERWLLSPGGAPEARQTSPPRGGPTSIASDLGPGEGGRKHFRACEPPATRRPGP
jgi:hypothetical protein